MVEPKQASLVAEILDDGNGFTFIVLVPVATGDPLDVNVSVTIPVKFAAGV